RARASGERVGDARRRAPRAQAFALRLAPIRFGSVQITGAGVAPAPCLLRRPWRFLQGREGIDGGSEIHREVQRVAAPDEIVERAKGAEPSARIPDVVAARPRLLVEQVVHTE